MAQGDIIWWDDDEALFIAQAQNIPGCRGSGNTVEEAEADLEKQKEKWMQETAKHFTFNDIPE